MGGVVPLGYRVEDRALHIVDDHAAIVRSLFQRYLEAGSVVRLKQSLDAEGRRIPVRIDGAGRSTGDRLKTLQKFSSVHAQVHNHFNQERHLVTRQVYKQRRSAALAEWRALAA